MKPVLCSHFRPPRLLRNSGIAVLETALGLVVFVTTIIAAAALFFFLINRQIIEHAVNANAAKIGTVPYTIGTRGGHITYTLAQEQLNAAVVESASHLATVLQAELLGAASEDLTVQVGYIELLGQAERIAVGKHYESIRGNRQQARSIASVDSRQLATAIGGIHTDGSGPSPFVLRVRVHLLTRAFTQFDVLRVAPQSIEYDIMVPLRQQAGLIVHQEMPSGRLQ